MVCKITKQIDYHEILTNELKRKNPSNLYHNDLVKDLKSKDNIKEECISEKDWDKYLRPQRIFNIPVITPPWTGGLNLPKDIFPKYYGFFFSASLNRCVMLFDRLKMTLEQYICMIKTDEALVFIIEEIFNMWKLLYENGLCHYDIKPDNIMLDYKYKLKLVDLGLLSFYGTFTFNGVCAPWFLPRKNIYFPLTYNETDTNDDFAFAIMILNIFLYLKKKKVLAAIGDEVVERSNVEEKLEKLGIKPTAASILEPGLTIPRDNFKQTIISLL